MRTIVGAALTALAAVAARWGWLAATWPERAALALIAAGVVLVAGHWAWHHVLWPWSFPRRVQQTMVQLALTSKAGEEPRLTRRSRQGKVWTLVWRMPVGIHTERVESQRRALEEHLDCSMRVWTQAGLLHMRIGRGRVPDVHMAAEAPPLPRAGALTVHLGMGREGPLVTDIARWPHGVIGGTSGSGKSELVRSVVLQVAQTHTPAEVQVVLVDLKGGMGMAVFDRLPHLLWPVVCRHEQAAEVLTELVAEQERRQDQLRGQADHLLDWNARRPGERLPHLLVIIDEFADLLPKDATTKIERAWRETAWAAASALTRMGRASGVHVLIATQRPDADVLPGQIRANCTGVVALFCANEFNSGILLGQGNAAACRLPTGPDGQPLPGRAIFKWGREVPFQAAYTPADEVLREVERLHALYAPAPSLPASQTVVPLRVAAGEE